jgi:hypothetical protein
VLPVDPAAALDEATSTMRDLAYSFYAFLPRLILVLILFFIAAVVTRAVRWLFDRTLRDWERREAASALTRLAAYLAAAVAAVSVLAGDVRAVVGRLACSASRRPGRCRRPSRASPAGC